MPSLTEILKKHGMVIAACLAAVISALFVPVTNYISYIDTDMIALLMSFMLILTGLESNNVFSFFTHRLLRSAGNSRKLSLLLVMFTFLLAALVTNDVALIVTVPFTILVFRAAGLSPVYTIVLETIAANMGGAITPFGNPQNLYIYSLSQMTFGEFVAVTGPTAGISLLFLIIAGMFCKRTDIEPDDSKPVHVTNIRYVVLYLICFLLCILSVLHLFDVISALAAVCVVIAILEPKLFLKADYGLLITFAAIFVFTGNIKNIPAVSQLMESTLEGHEFLIALGLSQIISNVPATIMVSGFTDKYREVILGADVGALGTLIASLASLISFRAYTKEKNADPKRYILTFTGLNLILLAILCVYHYATGTLT